MPRSGFPAIYPSPGQRLLLRAALCDGETALAAWNAWRSDTRARQGGKPTREPVPQRFAPLLLANLAPLGAPQLECLTEPSRRARMHVEDVARAASGVLRRLQQAAIPTLLLKGLAMAERWYPPGAARDFGDFDVLLHWRDVPRASSILESLGWSRAEPLPANPDACHARDYSDASAHLLDLHWFSLIECRWPGADDDLWSRAREGFVNGVPTRVLDATDQLVHVCLHGARHDSEPSSWAADAATLLRVAPLEIDWDRVIDSAAARRMVPAMATALRFLRDELLAAVPDRVVDSLEGMRVPLTDRLLFHVKTSGRSVPFFLVGAWLDYLRARRPIGIAATLTGFPRFLQDRWSLQKPGALPLHALARVCDFLRRNSPADRLRKNYDAWKRAREKEYLLYEAAFGPRATGAWRRWQRMASMDALDSRHHVLLCIIYRNLSQQGVAPADMPRLKGVWRYHWVRRTLLLGMLAPLLHRLHEAGIEALALGPLALDLAMPVENSPRPMERCDLMVRDEDRGRTLRLLQEENWTAVRDAADTWEKGGGGTVTLHRYAVSPAERIWLRAREAAVAGAPIRVPCRSDLLLHACLKRTSVAWMADALSILHRPDAMDWDVLAGEAASLRVVFSLTAALVLLKARTRAPIPLVVVGRLAHRRVSRMLAACVGRHA